MGHHTLRKTNQSRNDYHLHIGWIERKSHLRTTNISNCLVSFVSDSIKVSSHGRFLVIVSLDHHHATLTYASIEITKYTQHDRHVKGKTMTSP